MYAVREPSVPSVYPLSMPTRSHSFPNPAVIPSPRIASMTGISSGCQA